MIGRLVKMSTKSTKKKAIIVTMADLLLLPMSVCGTGIRECVGEETRLRVRQNEGMIAKQRPQKRERGGKEKKIVLLELVYLCTQFHNDEAFAADAASSCPRNPSLFCQDHKLR